MYIKEIKIKNFRGLDIEIDNIKSKLLIMGRNDTGKSNICYALKKLFDVNTRRIPFTDSDSTNNNCGTIFISAKLMLDNISYIERSSIGKYIDVKNGDEYINISLNAEYNKDLMIYEETIILGDTDETRFASNRSIPIDDILELVYVEPNYNLEQNSKNYFRKKKKENEKNERIIGNSVLDKTRSLNDSIKSDEIVHEMVDSINNNGNFDEIFEDISFDIQSNIAVDNIYASLNFMALDNEGHSIKALGDGKTKTLSLLLKNDSLDVDKHKIFILEEPENHMYPLLQKTYLELCQNLNLDQIFVTTHSPYIFDFKKMEQIVRLKKNGKITRQNSININEDTYKKFGYLLNEEIGEILFYDKVLLVEGVSEKYFYNTLFNTDDKFRHYVTENKMGIFSVGGVDFYPVKDFLEKLGITVYIKTDNDIFKVPKMNLKRYAGIERVLNCLDSSSKTKLANLLGTKELDKELFRFSLNDDSKKIIEDNLVEIQNIFEDNRVYLSISHEGFEYDFLEFIESDNIDDKDMEFLKKAKLKNLHEYVIEQQIPIMITEKNKDSILVRFMNDFK